MALDQAGLLDAALLRKGELITTWARAFCVGLAVLGLAMAWDDPRTRGLSAAAVGLAYLGFAAAAHVWRRRRPASRRRVKALHDVADALAAAAVAALSGGLDSPVWLLLYVHVVGVSVRGGLRRALALGLLDALLAAGLTAATPERPEGWLHALALLACAFMGGAASSHLEQVRLRLAATAERALRAEDEARQAFARQQETHRELERLDRLRGQYLSNVSHEFRTPLTVIRGYAEHLMNQGPPRDGSLAEVMEVLVDSCDQVIDMVDTLIEVGRIESEGEHTLERRRLDLAEVAASAFESLRVQAARKGIAVHLDFPGPVAVTGDACLLEHLVRKLLDNALDVRSRPGAGSVFSVRLPGAPQSGVAAGT